MSKRSKPSSPDLFPIIRFHDLIHANHEPQHFPDVTEAELIEILLRLPIDTVHRFKCVSKHWFALISDPYFLKRYVQLRPNMQKNEQFVLYHVCHAFKTNSSVCGGPALSQSDHLVSSSKCFDFSFDFLPVVRDRWKDPSNLLHQRGDLRFGCLGHSHGLVLCKALHRSSRDDNFKKSLYVCNPLTKQWLELPPSPSGRVRDSGIAGFICYSLDDSELPLKIGFTVVEVEIKKVGSGFFNTSVFSSKTGCWEIHRLSCSIDCSWSEEVEVPTMMVCNDKLYWDGLEYIVEYDPLNKPDKCELISYPPGVGVHRNIHASEGKLRVVKYHRDPSFSLWELENCGTDAWCFMYVIQFPLRFDGVGYFSRTNRDIVCFRNWSVGKMMLFDMENLCALGSFQVPFKGKKPDERAYKSAIPFVMTPWPTPIPQLPKHVQPRRTQPRRVSMRC